MRTHIDKRECPHCGAEEGLWHQEGCPHRPKPYSRVLGEQSVPVRYVREEPYRPMDAGRG